MRNYFAIVEREIKSYFSSPIAYIVIGLFLLFSGLFFNYYISRFAYACLVSNQQQYPQVLNVNLMAIRPILGNISFLMLLFLPLVTMRLYSEEKKSGTIELLMTSPVTNFQNIMGKFTASGILFFTMLASTLIFIILLFIYGNPEFGPILTGYLGLFLLGLSFISFGIFFSTLTDNQIISAILTMVFIFFFIAINVILGFGIVNPEIAKIVSNFSLYEPFGDFLIGKFDTKYIVFYSSFIFMGLFLSFVSIESSRWRGR